MEHAIQEFVVRITQLHWLLLFAWIAALMAVLVKGADLLVEESVVLARRSGVPTVVIGATVVSLGTTMPEAAISVFAALQGQPGLALGNAVGSVICDTGLILGLACLLGAVPLEKDVVNRQGWIQLGAGVLLAAVGLLGRFLSSGTPHIPQAGGFVFLFLLAVYIWLSIRWTRGAREEGGGTEGSTAVALLKLAGAVALVLLSSRLLIPAVEHAAHLLRVPDDIIAATLVAFGTSLPELVTAVTAVKKGQGALAVGNVIGADILNVLFVAGAAAAVTPGGLAVPSTFFQVHFPVMIGVLVLFRVGIFASKDRLKKPFGFLLLASYLVYLVVQYAVFGKIGT